MTKTLGEQITEIRTDLGLNMREFAEKINPKIESSNVSKWERDINVPTRERIKKIAELGNVPVEKLLLGEGYKNDAKTIDNFTEFELALELNRRGYRVCK